MIYSNLTPQHIVMKNFAQRKENNQAIINCGTIFYSTVQYLVIMFVSTRIKINSCQ